jgi:hypothetical protein
MWLGWRTRLVLAVGVVCATSSLAGCEGDEEPCQAGALGCACLGSIHPVEGLDHCDEWYVCSDERMCVEPEGDWHACGAVCEVLTGCDTNHGSAEQCVSTCDAEVKAAYDEWACGYFGVRLNECLAALSCEAYAAWRAGEPVGTYPCADEDAFVREYCSWR